MILVLASCLALMGGEPLIQETPPPRPQAPTDPQTGSSSRLADFDRFELYARAGILSFSDDFEADSSVGAGLFARVPSPWISQSLLGLDHDAFGLYLDVTVSEIERDIDPEPEDPDGTLFFAALGVDWMMLRNDTFLVSLQLGLQFGYFGGVTDLDDGVAFLPGLMLGWQFAHGLWLTVNPQYALADAGDSIFFGYAGVMIEF